MVEHVWFRPDLYEDDFAAWVRAWHEVQHTNRVLATIEDWPKDEPIVFKKLTTG